MGKIILKQHSWQIRLNCDHFFPTTAARKKIRAATGRCSIQPRGLAIEIIEAGFKPKFCKGLRWVARVREVVPYHRYRTRTEDSD
ncbi:MAG: hypothetical protein A2Y12_03570 [Planctomycetes bacterium GWF2_42_9]|nr:MAG: hypothetical protein A2Y12_03570 [Planctomycetes bacterium GWF2_42_9]